MEDLIIKIKYIADIEPIEKIAKGDWIDLRAAEDVKLRRGDFKKIPLGIAVELPKGYEAIVNPRSSTYERYGIIQTNSQGVIDESYNGDNDQWFYPCIALRDTEIKKNDRICQFRIQKHMPNAEIKAVGRLGNKDRNGFGSTGTN